MKRSLNSTALVFLACAQLALFSCSDDGRPSAERKSSDSLTSVYAEQAKTGTPTFSIVDRIARFYRANDDPWEMVAFLSSHIERFPSDPNNGTYLIYLGDYYDGMDVPEVASEYYLRSLSRYPELVRGDADTHVAALNRLLTVTTEPEEKIWYYQELLSRFPEYINVGRTYYYLAKQYEQAGMWDAAYDAYEQFLADPDVDIPGEPDARRETASKISFYESSRDWTWADLDALVASIKRALWTQDTAALLRHRAKENFFTMSWEQQESDVNSQIPSFDIGFFLRRSRVRYADDLDLASNAQEAYLRTWGWSNRIPTWYLYFRRVEFPSDPAINGTWEWAGIYFGESL